MSTSDELVFSRRYFSDVTLDASTAGPVQLGYEVVTGVGYEGTDLPSFHHFQEPGPHVSSEEMAALRVRMPSDMARRLAAFCVSTFVEGDPNFNCYSFVGFTLGWQSSPAKPTEERRYYGSPIPECEDTLPNQPYVVYAPETNLDGSPIVHAMLGADRAGYSLNVIGPEKPLAFVRTSDVKRLYAARSIIRVASRGR